MFDLMTPLGRPPLDTYSPTQMVRTADTMPVGVWEIEAGAIYAESKSTMPVAAVRVGVLPGLEFDAGFASYVGSQAARRNLGLRYAPIPALWSLDLAYDSLLSGTDMGVEVGSTLEIALPWFTPRVAPRVSYVQTSGRGATTEHWSPRVDLGVEIRALRFVTFGTDVDFGITDPMVVGLGARFRPIGNVGTAVFGTWTPPGQPTGPASPYYRLGAIAAVRF